MEGVHFMMDMYDCRPFSGEDPKMLQDMLTNIIEMVGMKLVKPIEPFLYDELESSFGWGWSLVGILADSHITIHTAPSKGNSMFFDLYSCNFFDHRMLHKYLCDTLRPDRYEFNVVKRNDFERWSR